MQMKRPFELLVAGEINPDLILSGDVVPAFRQVEKLVDSAVLVAGSSAVITASAGVRLGLRTAFIGVRGNDLFGDFMVGEMKRLGLDVTGVIVDPALPTGLTVILDRTADTSSREGKNTADARNFPPGDRAMLTLTGAMSALNAGDIGDDLLRQARHLHVASFFLQKALQPGLPDLFQRAHRCGLTTSLDTNWDPANLWVGMQEVLPLCDVLFLNENEAKAISGADGVEAAGWKLAESCGMVAIKQGAQGASVFRRKETSSFPAPVVNVVDTVGAGDTFNGGFLYGFLKGWSMEKSLQLGVICGSLSTRTAGGTSAQPTLDEALQHARPVG